MGADGVRCFTEQKGGTTHWFENADASSEVSNSWDGMIAMPDDKK